MSNDKLKEINIKNSTCYYFGEILGINDIFMTLHTKLHTVQSLHILFLIK